MLLFKKIRSLPGDIVFSIVAGAILIGVLGVITVVSAQTFTLNTRTSNGTIATTTNNTFLYPSTTATSTMDLTDTREEESFEMNISAVGSSTAAKLLWMYETSEDGVTYFQERCASANSNTSVSYGKNPCVYDIDLTTATSTINIPEIKIAGVYARIKFSTSGANARIQVQTPVKKPFTR